MNINYITEVAIFMICLISIITDLKYGIIKNTHLLTVGMSTIVLNANASFLYKDIKWMEYLFALIISIAISLILYFTKIWAGGDCKLYMVIALSMPYCIVSKQTYGISWIIFVPIIAFLIGYLFIIVDSILLKIKETDNKDKKECILKKAMQGFIKYLKYYLVIILVNRILSMIFVGLNITIININQWIALIINMIIITIIGKQDILKYKSVVLTLLVVDIAIGVLDIEYFFTRQTILTWIAIIICNLIKNFADCYNYEYIDIDKVRTGMILSTASSMIFVNDKLSRFKKVSDETLKSRLNEEDVEKIHDFSEKRKYLKQISIVKKIPFAMFISVATILVLIGGNLL